MKWSYNCWTGNSIGFYKNHQIIRTARTNQGYFYSSDIRFGLERKYLTFISLEACKKAISDEIRRTTNEI